MRTFLAKIKKDKQNKYFHDDPYTVYNEIKKI